MSAQFINDYLAGQWKAQKLTPAERCSDEEFIRRASLDLIGRVATPDEVRAFVKEAGADKRAKLVDQLLNSKDFVRNWAGVLTNWLVSRNTPPAARMQLYGWLQAQLAKNVSYAEIVRQLLSASGKAGDNGAVQFILANLGDPSKKPEADGAFDMTPAAQRALRVFLGYRVDASELPDHPVHPDFKPAQVAGVVDFLRQVERKGPDELADNPKANPKGAPVFLDGKKPGEKQTRREALGALVTGNDNFSKATVNRLWGHFFGRGLHEGPVVDSFSSQHKVVHPELLDKLAKEFASDGYDPKKLMKTICTSDAYQLKSLTNATNAKESLDVYFSRMPLKLMTPEQLLESLLTSVQADEATQRKLRAGGMDQIARRVGDSDWEALPSQERIIQNVVLINRKDLADALLTAPRGPVARAAALPKADQTLEELYLTALNRRPTDKEAAQLKALIEKESKDAKTAANLWQDLYWALLNSSEFILNH